MNSWLAERRAGVTGGGVGRAAEQPVHMTLVGEAALVGHLRQWDARPPQQRLGPGDAFVHHVGMRCRAGRLLEPPGELEAAQIYEVGQIADAEVVLQVLLFRRMLDRTRSPRGCG